MRLSIEEITGLPDVEAVEVYTGDVVASGASVIFVADLGFLVARQADRRLLRLAIIAIWRKDRAITGT